MARKNSLPIFESLEPRINFSSVLDVPSTALTTSSNTSTNSTVVQAVLPAITAPSNAGLSAPTHLIAAPGPFGIALSWTDRSSRELGVRIFRSSDGLNFTQIAQLNRGTTSYLDATVSPNTNYTYYVLAYNTKGNGKHSKSVSAPLNPADQPIAPSDLQLAVNSASTISLQWTDNAVNESGLHVYRSTDGVDFNIVANLPANTTTWDDNNIDPTQFYTYTVSAYNLAGDNVDPTDASTSIESAANFPLAPNAPLTTTTSNVSTNSLTLSWSEVSLNATGFNVYRSTDGINSTLVATLPSSTTTFNDTGLSANTIYYYSISSVNGAGETIAPPVTVATAVVANPAPVAPSGLNSSGVTSNSVTLNWTTNSNDQWGVNIYRATGGTYTLLASINGGFTTFTDTTVNASTAYTYYVSGWNGGGAASSNTIAVTTQAALTNSVSISTKNETSFTELDINGTSGNDTITVAQSNNILTITANGQNYTYTNTFGDLVIQGEAGNDTITVAAGVNIPALIYGGDGNDTLTNMTSAKATIVSIGNGTDTLTGNGINTAYWANPGDTINASAAEIALGGVNRIANFYQPWSTDPNNANYISRELSGQSLADPTDSGTEIKLANSSFFGTGPVLSDVNQGELADCYFVGPLSALANVEPARLQNMGVDLGDGTYAVRFIRNGITTYVRVDGDLTTGYFYYGLNNTTPGATGNLWASIFEKAYAFYRTGANTYASINWGSPTSALRDLGITSSAFSLGSTTAAVALSTINSEFAQGHAVTVSTNATIVGGAPLIDSHVYTVVSAYLDGSGNLMLQLYNPWGIDGFNVDSNPNDGLVVVSYATLVANANQSVYTTM